MSLRIRLFAAVLLASAAFSQAALAGACAPQGADPAEAVRQLYAAVNRGDSASAAHLLAPGFYAFDHGQRMSGAELTAQVDEIRRSRPPYTWTVEYVDAHVACAMAWVSYTNRHVPTPGATVPLKAYLESVVLVWLDGGWKLQFFHSTPAQVQ
jgi:uncharacterized protein DUF4440